MPQHPVELDHTVGTNIQPRIRSGQFQQIVQQTPEPVEIGRHQIQSTLRSRRQLFPPRVHRSTLPTNVVNGERSS